MRKSCIDCVMKHLGSAGIFVKETKMGYPDYDIWAIGELEHAADECLEYDRGLAMTIREHRLLWTSDHSHMIPFEAINRYLKDCLLADSCETGHPELPAELLEGIEVDNGKPVFQGDTRPS